MKYAVSLAIALSLLSAAPGARAREYQFVFPMRGARFDPTLGDNRATLGATLQLLRDYQGARDVHFVFVGEARRDCNPAEPSCNSDDLLRQRVESVSAELSAATTDVTPVARLEWQAIPSPADGSHVERIGLRWRVDALDAAPHPCAYRVEILDPRLPPPLTPGTTGEPWMPIAGLVNVMLSPQASVRVRAGGVAVLTVTQRLPTGDVVLALGSSEAHWPASKLQWSATGADVDIRSGAMRGGVAVAESPSDSGNRADIHVRDVGNDVQSWSPPADPSSGSGLSSGVCRMHFELIR